MSSRMGRDLRKCGPNLVVGRFNPRARMGRDQYTNIVEGDRAGFNPRARMGRDYQVRLIGGIHLLVSIHAPAWGATFTATDGSSE